MDWKKTLELAWKNRAQIADGFWNAYVVNKPEITKEAERRRAICESNVCGWYDPKGQPETSAVPGQPACSLCHCNTTAKVNCTYCYCALLDRQIQRLKEIRPDTNVQDLEGCRKQIQELKDKGVVMGPDPLWDVMMTQDMDNVIRAKEHEQQFKNR